MDWDKLKSFYEIAISKSISKASAKLNISQSDLCCISVVMLIFTEIY